MSTLTFRLLISASLLAGLAGCGGDNGSPAPVESDKTTQASRDGKIECALAASNSFERVCSTEQISANGGIMLVIRHPDGGFRRFNILTDGRGLAPTDGFDETRINLLDDDMIELSSGDDKYRLPALIRTDAVDDRSGRTKDAS